MKTIYTLPALLVSFSMTLSSLFAGDPPRQLGDYLIKDKVVRGEVVRLDVPAEFMEFERVLKKVRQEDPKWFAEHMKKTGKKSTIPNYDAKLGISKKEYDRYLELWNKRGYKKVDKGDVNIMLTEEDKGEWVVNVSGMGVPISLIKYNAKKDAFISGNGEMKRIANIDSPADSIYRAWKGYEWRYFNESDFVRSKENFAIGRTGDGRYGIMIYSLQEVSNNGTPLADQLMIIRFVPRKFK